MMVAQHFSAGLAFLNTSVPSGTIEFDCHPPENAPTCSLSIVPDGTDPSFPTLTQH
jgi:hypothetical protein